MREVGNHRLHLHQAVVDHGSLDDCRTTHWAVTDLHAAESGTDEPAVELVEVPVSDDSSRVTVDVHWLSYCFELGIVTPRYEAGTPVWAY